MSTAGRSWFHRRGALAVPGWDVVVDSDSAGFAYAGLRVTALAEGQTATLAVDDVERLIVPLTGSFEVTHEDGAGERMTRMRGRSSVFDGPTDVLYLPTRTAATIRGTGRVAVAEAPTGERRDWQYIPAARTPVELRGGGSSTRQVHNFGTPQALDAVKLIVCEVITPAGNWSSYPPHKHDETVPGHESQLEEIYYFESSPVRGAEGVSDAAAFGLFSTHSSPAGEIEIDKTVRTGDVALVPYGYHGPAVAAPGYDLYYLNVMAGPAAEREWLISDEPAHAWVRSTWQEQGADPRLPYMVSEKGDG
ncbi:5-deoxy-glucuronate isomerase [Microbacterium sp.]|uniref:5-deoxy-glucuronate isomerase n=1 Tax=Microbacterium sp. TaxID=51671 RepID=UPI003C7929CA